MDMIRIGMRDVPTLKRMFDRYAEESITDEMVERVLAPVLALIQAGVFDRSGRRNAGLEKRLFTGIRH